MSGKVKSKMKSLTILVALFIVFLNGKVYAVESEIVSEGTVEQEIVSVVMPTVNEEESPFDFIIDPQNLLYDTNAELYGGGLVEEGAHLLFHNRSQGEYTFSSCSDQLTVTNHSTAAVTITVFAKIDELGDITLLPNREFLNEERCGIYLSLVDDEGNEQPLCVEREVSVSTVMQNEFDTYSFGLQGDCGVNGVWDNISVHPKVTVTWCVEPIHEEETESIEKEPIPEDKTDITTEEVEDNSIEDMEKDKNIDENETIDDIENTAKNEDREEIKQELF